MSSYLLKVVFILFIWSLASADELPKNSREVAKIELNHTIYNGFYRVDLCNEETASGVIYTDSGELDEAVTFCIQEVSHEHELNSQDTKAALYINRNEEKLCFWQLGGKCEDYGSSGTLCISYQALDDCIDLAP